MKQLRTLLAAPGIGRLLIAQTPADFADWLDFVVIGTLLAFHWQVDPFVFALLGLAFGLPYLTAGPIAGALVDRMDLRTVLIGSNLARAAMTLAMAFAGGWPVLLALIFLRGIADSFFAPAKQAALQSLTTPEVRNGANGLSHAINQASKIAAPALGGALLLAMQPSAVFVVNAAVSLSAAAILWRLAPLRPSAGREAAARGMLAQLGEGLRELRGKPVLRGTLVLMAAGYFAMFFYDTLIAPLIRDLALTQAGLGLSLTAVGAGGVLGAAALGLGAAPRRPLLWIAAASVLSALLVCILGVAEIQDRRIGLVLTCAIFALLGFASSLGLVPTRTILQNEVAPDHIARVTALSEAANALAILTAPFLGAALANASSVGWAFVAGGALMFATGAGAVVLHRRHGRR